MMASGFLCSSVDISNFSTRPISSAKSAKKDSSKSKRLKLHEWGRLPLKRSVSVPVGSETVTVSLNNQPIKCNFLLAYDIENAKRQLILDPKSASIIEKKLLLNRDILIGLLNETKMFLQQSAKTLFNHSYKNKDCLEQAFINNKHLSETEKLWVEATIKNYKQSIIKQIKKDAEHTEQIHQSKNDWGFYFCWIN